MPKINAPFVQRHSPLAVFPTIQDQTVSLRHHCRQIELEACHTQSLQGKCTVSKQSTKSSGKIRVVAIVGSQHHPYTDQNKTGARTKTTYAHNTRYNGPAGCSVRSQTLRRMHASSTYAHPRVRKHSFHQAEALHPDPRESRVSKNELAAVDK